MTVASLRVASYFLASVSIANVILFVWQFNTHVFSGTTSSALDIGHMEPEDLRLHTEQPRLRQKKLADHESKSEGRRLSCVENSHHNKRVLFFYGTRPEINKMAPVIQTFRTNASNNTFKPLSIFTGQHVDLIKPFEMFWNMSADFHLRGTMQNQQTLTALTGRLITAIEESISPCASSDVWVVQGDTTSAFAVSLVAFYRQIPLVHIEAGLRTFNMRSPFPEEFNRKAIGLLANIHFAPTNLSRQNLIREGVDPNRIFITGNTGIDAVRLAGSMEVTNEQPPGIPVLHLWRHKYVLVTLHRRENQANMREIYDAIQNSTCPGAIFIVSVHPNPASSRASHELCKADSRFVCVPPLGYAETQWLLKHSSFVLTDSGGIQEETTWYGTPTIVVRSSTERPEAQMAGLTTVTINPAMLQSKTEDLCLSKSALYKQMSRRLLPFGDGHASERILQIMVSKHSLLEASPGQMRPPPAL